MSEDTKGAHAGVRGMQGVGKDAFGEAAGVGKDVSGYAPEQVGAESFLGGKGFLASENSIKSLMKHMNI